MGPLVSHLLAVEPYASRRINSTQYRYLSGWLILSNAVLYTVIVYWYNKVYTVIVYLIVHTVIVLDSTVYTVRVYTLIV